MIRNLSFEQGIVLHLTRREQNRPISRMSASALLVSAWPCFISGYLNQFNFKRQIFAGQRMIGIECQVFVGDLYNSDRYRLSVLLINLQLHSQFWSYIGRELIFRSEERRVGKVVRY